MRRLSRAAGHRSKEEAEERKGRGHAVPQHTQMSTGRQPRSGQALAFVFPIHDVDVDLEGKALHPSQLPRHALPHLQGGRTLRRVLATAAAAAATLAGQALAPTAATGTSRANSGALWSCRWWPGGHCGLQAAGLLYRGTDLDSLICCHRRRTPPPGHCRRRRCCCHWHRLGCLGSCRLGLGLGLGLG